MSAHLALTQLVPLAAEELDKNKVTPGVLGFVVFAVLALAVWALMKSMNRHMNRISFDEPADPAEAEAEDGGQAGKKTGKKASAAS